MPEYKNGKIYKLVCNITHETYIGSTTQSIEERLRIHEGKHNGCCSKQIIERNDYYIELLETYPCETEYELLRKEGEYHRTTECINQRIAGRTINEWNEDYREYRMVRQKKYRLLNKDYIRQDSKIYRDKHKTDTIICECGFECLKSNIARHRKSQYHINAMNG